MIVRDEFVENSNGEFQFKKEIERYGSAIQEMRWRLIPETVDLKSTGFLFYPVRERIPVWIYSIENRVKTIAVEL